MMWKKDVQKFCGRRSKSLKFWIEMWCHSNVWSIMKMKHMIAVARWRTPKHDEIVFGELECAFNTSKIINETSIEN